MTGYHEVPVLWLGLAGFDPQGRAALSQIGRSYRGQVTWRFSAFVDADAWLINGSKVQVLESECIRVTPGLPTERSLRLSMRDVDRPVAFAAPLVEGFEPRCSFNLALPSTLHDTLTSLADWLKPRQGQFALGREIVRRGHALRHGVFHVMSGGRLLAVLNLLRGRVGVSAAITPDSLASATWSRMPPSAGEIPPGFVTTTVAQLSWTYVRHSDQKLLPLRYRNAPIYFRGAPKVPLRWVSDSQLLLIRELNAEPATMTELRQRTALPAEQIERDLTCLYFAGAITTTVSKATGAIKAASEASSSGPEVADLMRATEAPDSQPERFQVPGGLTRQYATVPAPLIEAR
jgi:hypothetical protein